MEKLQELLTDYNKKYIPDDCRCSWSKQFCNSTFPKYWYEVFKAVAGLDRNLKVLEVGCGQGDITSIFCYLGFKQIDSFERDHAMSNVAEKKIKHLFNRNGIIKAESFPTNKRYKSDILVLVNCVYSDDTTNKEEYMQLIRKIYEMSGAPEIFILEVIDPDYDIPDDNFPFHIRLSNKDIVSMFPDSKIDSIETYRYPKNKRTKRLYIINSIK